LSVGVDKALVQEKPMSARKIQDETEARECITKESGLTLAQWARSAGIDGRSLHAGNVNLARRRHIFG
jgi:hypothetical protein